MIHLGTYSTELDPGEGNAIAERAGALSGQTFGTVDGPLYDHVVSVIAQGAFVEPNDALNQQNPSVNDTFEADLDGDGTIGPGEGQGFDAVVTYNVTLTYADGSTAQIVGPIVQTNEGDLYLVPAHSGYVNADATNAAPYLQGHRVHHHWHSG